VVRISITAAAFEALAGTLPLNCAAAEYLSGKARELENDAITASPSTHGSVRPIDQSRACAKA
jgi:hypothetical protein